MGISMLQKIKLAFRGWQRRREEGEKEFVARNTGWAGGQAPSPVGSPSIKAGQARAPVLQIDVEGLQVAYLDDSGQLVHYLDMHTGEVVDVRAGEPPFAAPRYRRVPSRTIESDAEDRRAFVASRERSATLDRLTRAVDDADAFRAALAADRALERAWYNFKNDRALAVVTAWLG